MVDLEQFIRDLNRAWREHRYEDLREYFHDEAVMLPPGTTEAIVGVEPMIQSYRQFGSVGTIHAFDTTNLTIHRIGAVSICHMCFEVDYEIESGRFRERGLEIYVIDTADDDPRVVWRTQIATKPDRG